MAPPLPLVVVVGLLLLVCSSAVGQQEEQRLREARECRIQSLSTTRHSRSIQSEGGVTELWDEEDEQFQCAGVAPMRNIIQPNSLSLPNYSPSHRLVYIERGQGLLGLSIPGCVETFHSRGQSQSPRILIKGQADESIRDQHQKVHRLRQGDIVALPAGVAHWCYNDGNEELVALSITDLNSESNQLDQQLRSFYLAGEQSREEQFGGGEQTGKQGRQPFGKNIIRGFDAKLIADAFNIPLDLAKKIQREDERGLIVRVQKGGMSIITPDEEESEQGANNNIFGFCNAKLTKNMNYPGEADIYTRQGGRLNIVNKGKLPILESIDMSAEKGSLYPNAIMAPHWSMNSHSIQYVTRGEGRMQVVGNNGKTMLDQTVKQGDLIVVPQFFATLKKAGNKGLEWVSFKTSSLPISTPLVGSSSAFNGFPLQVLSNAYQISDREAQGLKQSRGDKVMLFPPSSSSSRA